MRGGHADGIQAQSDKTSFIMRRNNDAEHGLPFDFLFAAARTQPARLAYLIESDLSN
ncbi:hypothetical protein BSFA1_75980 (plasmid) [Burkholderia sp. SFA1]|nr:hypothetical protein BSFA1_75980 [Burkholderia sp. SFA1]